MHKKKLTTLPAMSTPGKMGHRKHVCHWQTGPVRPLQWAL